MVIIKYAWTINTQWAVFDLTYYAVAFFLVRLGVVKIDYGEIK